MIGYDIIREVSLACPDAEYQRLAVNGRGLGAYYSFRYRHGLLTRYGVVFQTIANATPDYVQEVWHRQAEKIDSFDQHLPKERYEWQGQLMTDAVATKVNALGMYNALNALYNASHTETGEQLRSIRPVGLRQTLELVMDVYREVREDMREALRVTRTRTPEDQA